MLPPGRGTKSVVKYLFEQTWIGQCRALPLTQQTGQFANSLQHFLLTQKLRLTYVGTSGLIHRTTHSDDHNSLDWSLTNVNGSAVCCSKPKNASGFDVDHDHHVIPSLFHLIRLDELRSFDQRAAAW